VAGTRLGNAPGATSLCDAVLAPMPGAFTFSINAPRLGGGLVVSDAEALAAMRVAFGEFGLIVEAGGAVALAAVLSERLPVADRTVAVVLTGANVDPGMFHRALSTSG
jgi:threonine dehydratase